MCQSGAWVAIDLLGEADVHHVQLPGVVAARRHQEAQLRQADGDGDVGHHGGGIGRTIVARHPRRDVHRRDGDVQLVEGRQQVAVGRSKRRRDPRAEHRVDHQGTAGRQVGKLGGPLSRASLVQGDRPGQPVEVHPGIAAQLVARRQEQHPASQAGLGQHPGHHQAVAAVVALAADQEHRCGIIEPAGAVEGIANSATRAFHELAAGGAGGDGVLVDGRHLAGGDDAHGQAVPWLSLSSTSRSWDRSSITNSAAAA